MSDHPPAPIAALTARLAEILEAGQHRLATAESCTGGWIAKACTDRAGSSGWFEGGWVTYSNEAKQHMLGVQAATLAAHGAVSEAVVREMAAGALARSAATISVAVSGVAGPGGGSEAKPVGTVWFGYAWRGAAAAETAAAMHRFDGDREAVRLAAVAEALSALARLADPADAA